MKKIFIAILASSLLSVSVYGLTPTPTPLPTSTNMPSQKVENFVKRFYVEVLGRTADPLGLNDWTNRLTTQVSAASDVATGFVFSAEYLAKDTTDVDFVNTLYSAFFGRAADTGGFDDWIAKINDGMSREDVLNGFLYSSEFDVLAKAAGIKTIPDGQGGAVGGNAQDFVKRFYSEVLGRTADEAGLNDWTSKLYSKEATGADIALGFTGSAEFTGKPITDLEFVNILYKAFFNRTGDNDGVNGWLGQLEGGKSRTAVVNGFLHSDEFVNLCNGYHIVAYEGAPKYVLVKSTYVSPYENNTWDEDINITNTYDLRGNILTHSETRFSSQIKFIPATIMTTYAYDNNDNVLKIESPIYIAKYTYNAEGKQLTSDITYGASDSDYTSRHSSVFTYYYNGNVATFHEEDSSGCTGLSKAIVIHESVYDENGKLTSKSATNDGITYTAVYTIGANGQVATVTMDGGTPYTYEYDGANRIITDNSVYLYRGTVEQYHYTYDAQGNRVASTTTDENGATRNETYEYDANGHRIKKTYTNDDGTYSYSILYDSLGNEIAFIDDTYISVDAYDTRGNVVLSKSYSDGVETSARYSAFTYDVHNNLLTAAQNDKITTTNEWMQIP